jgi:hypothetical protein
MATWIFNAISYLASSKRTRLTSKKGIAGRRAMKGINSWELTSLHLTCMLSPRFSI